MFGRAQIFWTLSIYCVLFGTKCLSLLVTSSETLCILWHMAHPASRFLLNILEINIFYGASGNKENQMHIYNDAIDLINHL